MKEKKPLSSDPKARAKGLGTTPPAKPRWWRRPGLWLAVLLGAPTVAVAVHGALWYLATQQIIDQTTAQLRILGRQGWTTFADAPVRAGYPWMAEVSIPGIRIAGPLLEWQAERLVIRLALFQPQTVRIAAEGRQSARLGNAPMAPFSATRDEAIVDLSAPDVLNVELDGLQAAMPAGQLTAETLRLRLDRAALTLGLDVGSATLPGLPPAWPLGAKLDRLGLDAAVQGGLPADTTAPALKTWRDAGGRIDLTRLSVGWGAVKAAGQLRLSLDPLLQPNIDGQLRVGGFGGLIDALVAGNLLAPRQAPVMRAVLGMLARPADDTGPDSVDLPVTLRDRSLNVGRIPLLRLPEFIWPAGK